MFRSYFFGLLVATLACFASTSHAQPTWTCGLDAERCEFCSLGQYGSVRSAVYYPQYGICAACSELCPYGRFARADDNQLATVIRNEVLAAIEERLILKIEPHEAEAVATLNANAAAALLVMAEMSARPNFPVPSTGSVKMAFDHSPATIRRIILGDLSDSNFRKNPQGNGGMDPVGSLTYSVVRRSGSSYMELRYRATGDSSESASNDVRVLLERIKGKNGEYWKYAGSQLVEKVVK